jgi:hypothetical protein
MKKPIYIFLVLFCFSCEVTEIKDSKYEYMYGKWKSESHDELWIDHNYVFFGCPDFPLICNYYIKNDSIYCYLKTRDKILRKNALPKLLNSDTIIFGQHIDENIKSIPTKYYRVRKNLPVIDTTKNWEKQALLEIVNYSYDKK